MAAFRKALSHRFSQLVKTAAAATPSFRGRPPSLPPGSLDPAPPGSLRCFVSSFLQKRPIFQPALPPDRLVEQLRHLNPYRIGLDLLSTPPTPAPCFAADDDDSSLTGPTVRKLDKALRVTEALTSLRATGRSCISYSEFLQICGEACGGDDEAGADVARSLNESSLVIVWGNVVSLRPEEVTKVIRRIIDSQTVPTWSDAQSEELREMESVKAEIDRRAAVHVKRELWGGLILLLAQTVASMRITFWELSWDVMEPICFYLGSIYFMVAYVFFMRTSTEPSFESFFKSRFAARQRRLMKARNFNVERFNELRRACPTPTAP